MLCSVSNGVKQGGVLSPILFTVYIDELLTRLSNARLGCHVGNIFCGALGYADDITLLAPTLSSLKSMLSICQKFAQSYDVLFNSSKSKLLYFGQSYSRPIVSPIEFNRAVIELVNNEKHLGNVIGQKCIKHQLQESIHAFNAKVNMVKSHFHHIDSDGLYQIFKTYCMPLYGSQLWDYDNQFIDKFYIAWRKAIRKLFDLPNMTHCNLLPYICDDVAPNMQLYRRVISFVKGLSISRNVLSSICYRLAINGSNSAVSNTISILSSLWSVPRSSVCHINRNIYPRTSDSNLAGCSSVIRDLLYMKHINSYYPHTCIFNNVEIQFIIDTLCTE